MNIDYFFKKRFDINDNDITLNGKYYRLRKNIGKFRYDISGINKEELFKKLYLECEKNDIYYSLHFSVMIGTMNHDYFIDEDYKLRTVLSNLDMKSACNYAKANSWIYNESLDTFYIVIVDDKDDFKNMLHPMLFVYRGVVYKFYPTLSENDYNILDVFEDTDFVGDDSNLSFKKNKIREIEKKLSKVINYNTFRDSEKIEEMVNDFLMINYADDASYERYVPNGKHHIPDNYWKY